jgi:hypothetical protein
MSDANPVKDSREMQPSLKNRHHHQAKIYSERKKTGGNATMPLPIVPFCIVLKNPSCTTANEKPVAYGRGGPDVRIICGWEDDADTIL